MVKQNKVGVTNDLPWWFELYHTAWIIFFFAVWYCFGLLWLFVCLLVVGAAFLTFA